MDDGECGASFAWGGPTFYDSTIRIVEAIAKSDSHSITCNVASDGPNRGRVIGMLATAQIMYFLAGQLADTDPSWSIGTFGAIAEFSRDANEAAELRQTSDAISVVTDKGGLRIVPHPNLRLIASESPATGSWSHRIALCLPHGSCAMSGREVFREIGADGDALRPQDRDGVLFDLGLGILQIDACVRVNDPAVVAALRRCTGKSVFAPGNDAMRLILAANPHRVFVSRIGRAEVFQSIPPRTAKALTGRTLTSEAIVAELVKKPDRPWADWKHGKAITPKALAALLKPFNIIPERLYLQTNPDSRGYARHALEEAFSCYLPPLECDDVTETLQPHAQVTAFQCGGAPPPAATLQNRRKPLGQWRNRRIATLKSLGRPEKENRR